MIGVGGVVVGAEDGGKEPAAAVADLAEEGALLRITARPITRDGDPRPVGEVEAGHVDGVGGRMLARPARRSGGSRHPATGVGAEVVDRDHAAIEVASRRGSDDLAFPDVERRRQGASHRHRIGPAHRRLGDRHDVLEPAEVSASAVGQRPHRERRTPDRLHAVGG